MKLPFLAIFPSRIPIQKYVWRQDVCLSIDFRGFCCTFFGGFGSRYWQENILPPAELIKILPENSFSEVRFNTIVYRLHISSFLLPCKVI